MRTCGECTMCCKMLAVTELTKPAGEWCSNCIVGSGCAIHEEPDYPESCGKYKCLWLLEETLPEAFRPDRIKVVPGTTTDGKNLVVYSRTPDLSHAPKYLQTWVFDHMRKFMDVIVVCGDQRKLYGRAFDKLQ